MFKSVPFRPLTLGCAVALSLFGGTHADAHAALKRAQPSAGAKLSTPPSAVNLEFGESVVPKLSGIEIRDAAGKPVPTGQPARGNSAAALTVSIPQPLAAGTYIVTWHAVSVDTHRTQGKFSFTVAP